MPYVKKSTPHDSLTLMIRWAAIFFAIANFVIHLLLSSTPAGDEGSGHGQWTLIIPTALAFVTLALTAQALARTRLYPLLCTLCETSLAIVLIAFTHEGPLFALYLFAPVVAAGVTSGLAASGLNLLVAAGSLLWLSVERLDFQGVWQTVDLLIPALATTSLIVWQMHRRPTSDPESIDVAYVSAHRLLSELHVVARQLSLGLDPQTMAAALMEEVRSVIPDSTCSVLHRSSGGRFLPLMGSQPTTADLGALNDAWRTARLTRTRQDGQHVAVLPVRMGVRVVALVIVTTFEEISSRTLNTCRNIIDQAGPRLATAMLFDDVRRLATADERMRLAREIHDGIAQDLASLSYLIDDIRADVPDPGLAERVAGIRDHVHSMVSDLRLRIFDLRASVDDAVSLGAALSEYANRVGARSGLKVHVSMDETGHRLPIATEVELLRMAQEAITNVRKHSGAANLWITVKTAPPNARITVVDDGSGLGLASDDSMGITGMQERAQRIGAKLHIGPGAFGGTAVEIVFPSTWQWQHADEQPTDWLDLTGPVTGEIARINLTSPTTLQPNA